MGLHKMLSKRMQNSCRLTLPSVNPDRSPSLKNTTFMTNAAAANLHRDHPTPPDSGEKGFFRRLFHRTAKSPSSGFPAEFFSIPVGEKLRENLWGISIPPSRLRQDGLLPTAAADSAAGEYLGKLSVEDTRKLLRLSHMEKLKAKLREIPKSSVSYREFVQVCAEGCENLDQGFEFAKMLDDSGNVIVLGNIVFLRPEKVARSMAAVIYESVALPNDPRRAQLEEMEKLKAMIDKKAKAQVRGELCCGLGLLVVQTLGFMRLTFWELSWDVMEPICFFVTSFHFATAYLFFLKTSTEPTFEGYFQRRYKAKQMKLMKLHNFDIEKFNKLCKVFYPDGSTVRSSNDTRVL